jgi:hypothetical protein
MFFEGFLGEAFFQESSPKRVPYKSKFELSDVFSVAFLLLTFLFAKRKVRASFTITKKQGERQRYDSLFFGVFNF